MKKIDLVHTTILIVAILTAYGAITTLISIISMLVFAIQPGMLNPATQQMGFTLVILLCFVAVTILLVRNGRHYAELMLRNDPEILAEDTAKWDLDRRNILLVMFIGLGLYTLINSVPYTLNYLYVFFVNKVHQTGEESANKDSLIIELLRITIAFFLIYAAPALTNYIEKTIAVRLENNDNKP